MDPRSSLALSDRTGALELFLQAHGPRGEHLLGARAHTARALTEIGLKLGQETLPSDTSVVLFGSWARLELTGGSDDDWVVLVDGPVEGRSEVGAVVDLAKRHLGQGDRKPGAQGIFGGAISCDELVAKVGLDEDTNTNLTRRALLLLESVEVAGSVHAHCRRRVLERYLNYGVKDFRPPRFLLNDIVRYWRTVGVDFEGKHRDTGGNDPKWVERNVKLRTARKVLFAGGLVPILQCHLLAKRDMPDYLEQQLTRPPTDRLAVAFEHYGAIDEGVRFFGAYDRWMELMRDQQARAELAALRFETREASSLFAEIRQIGEALDQALIALLFDTPLSQVARKYAVL